MHTYRGVLVLQISLYDKAPVGTMTIAKCVDYAVVLSIYSLTIR